MKLLLLFLSLIFLSACDPSNLNAFFEEPREAIENPIELPLSQYVALFNTLDFNEYIPRHLVTYDFILNLIHCGEHSTNIGASPEFLIRFSDGHELFLLRADNITFIISYRESNFESITPLNTWWNLGWGTITINDNRLLWHEGINFFRVNQ